MKPTCLNILNIIFIRVCVCNTCGFHFKHLSKKSAINQKTSIFFENSCTESNAVLSLHSQKMVVVAQLVERRIVVPNVAGSSPVLHPQRAAKRLPFCV